MSRLIAIDPQIQSEPEPEGYEFGYYIFDSLPMHWKYMIFKPHPPDDS